MVTHRRWDISSVLASPGRSRTLRAWAGAGLGLGLFFGEGACSERSGDPELQGGPGAEQPGEDGQGGSEPNADDGGGGAVRYDVGAPGSSSGAPGSGEGCTKVDFLFAIDPSGSMGNDQDKLAVSVPGFLDAIVDRVGVQDFHIMVVDTDTWATQGSTGHCSPVPACCPSTCERNWQVKCGDVGCWEIIGGNACDVEMGAGRRFGSDARSCQIAEDRRWITRTQPDLAGTFDCMAHVGQFGSSQELAMEAVVAAVSPAMNAPGGCNQDFLRPDAILVVTVITDEPNQSSGNPDTWWQALTEAKNGDPEAVVTLGFTPDDDPDLKAFAQRRGEWEDVESPDYAPRFIAAIAGIDTTCRAFRPPR